MNQREIARQRSQFYQAIRNYFHDLDYVETETPLLSSHLIPESAIEVFETKRIFSNGASEQAFLTPSPEIYMKKLISQGIGNCYQLTKSFRNLEDQSRKHANEFTMLEWYGMDINYFDNIAVIKALLQALVPLVHPDSQHLFTEFTQVTMHQLFLEYVNINLDEAVTLENLQAQARNAGFSGYVEKTENWEDLFNFIFVAHIENRLPQDKTVFVTDYPAQIATTARRRGNHYERWELYMQGWEIANCYTEEARYEEMLTLFQQEGAIKSRMKVPHPVNYEYLDIFKDDKFPPCSGAALGVDRLFAVAMNAQSLAEVALF